MALSARTVILVAALAMSLFGVAYAPNGGRGVAADIGPKSSACARAQATARRGLALLSCRRARTMSWRRTRSRRRARCHCDAIFHDADAQR
jgi:hypothetical protein